MPTATVNKMGRKKKDEPTTPMRLPRSFVLKIRHLADRAGKDPGDWLVDEFGAAISQQFAKAARELARKDGRADE